MAICFNAALLGGAFQYASLDELRSDGDTIPTRPNYLLRRSKRDRFQNQRDVFGSR
jgi:hypothetical protein